MAIVRKTGEDVEYGDKLFIFKGTVMKKILALFVLVFLGLSTTPLYPKGQADTSNEPEKNNKIINFRDYEWGSSLSLVLENEGEPDSKGFTTDHLIGNDEYPSDYTYTRDEKIEVYMLHYFYPGISVAGYEKCFMTINFYKDSLFSAMYDFSHNTTSNQKLPLYRDILNKLKVLYGEPNLPNNGYTAEWNNIRLQYIRDYDGDGYVFLYYYSNERIKMVNEKRRKENEMRTIQQNNTSGL